MGKKLFSRKLAFYFAAISGLVVVFQNCSPVNFNSADSSLNSMEDPSIPVVVPVVSDPIKIFKPSLATRQADCILCHGKIEGNLITSFNGGQINEAAWRGYDLYNGDVNHVNGHTSINMTAAEAASLAAVGSGVSLTYLHSSIKGKLYLPVVPVPEVEKTKIAASINYLKAKNILNADTSTVTATVAKYVDALLNKRTPSYRSLLGKNLYTGEVNELKDAVTDVIEAASVHVGAYTVDEIRALLPQSSSSAQIQNLGGAYQNIDGQTLECEGDLVFDGPVVLKNLTLKTAKGCRIYSTSSIFVYNYATESEREGINFVGGPQANIQLISARAVLFGMGSCTYKMDDYTPSADLGSVGRRSIGKGVWEESFRSIPIVSDFLLLRSKGIYMPDAGDCKGLTDARRKAHFKHVFVSAPEFHNRYTGDFKGVAIAPYILGAVGGFKYSYDEIFDSVSIAPLLKVEKVFSLKE